MGRVLSPEGNFSKLPLAVELARAGFYVTGVDINEVTVEAVKLGESYITDVDTENLKELVSTSRLSSTRNYADLASCSAVSICVPTPLRKTRDPDSTHVLDAVRALLKSLHEGMLIILESTTYPGTTEEAVLPILEGSGLRVGFDFCLCYSPERVDPANCEYTARNNSQDHCRGHNSML